MRYSAIHDKAVIQNPFNDTIEGSFATHYAITKRFVEKYTLAFRRQQFCLPQLLLERRRGVRAGMS